MKYNISELKSKLKTFEKKSLGFYPTPLHKLENISDELGVNIYIKREDLSGTNLFGGNKIRKLEYIFGDVLKKKCDTVITYGATQSNHAMQTVSACRKAGISPVLCLGSIVKPDYNDIRSNYLLDYVMGADIELVEGNGESLPEFLEKLMKTGEKKIAELEKQGHKCYSIPSGGSTLLGTVGFVECFVEILEYMEGIGQEVDHIFHPTGTGGTLAGILAGKKLLNKGNITINSTTVAYQPEDYENDIIDKANEVLELFESDERVQLEDLDIDRNYYGAGYEIPSETANEAIRLLASKEGILTDPIYSGKAFDGMIDYIRSGRVKKGSNIVFIHTGGATALFAEKEMVGNIANI